MWRFAAILLAATLLLCLAGTVSAHEIYVLNQSTIARDVAARSPDPLTLIPHDELQFFFWGFLATVLVVAIFLLSMSHFIQRGIDPWLLKLKPYAGIAARWTLGVCMIAAGYFNALFGPEIPLSTLFGSFAPFWRAAFFIIGVFLILGFMTRPAALVALLGFITVLFNKGMYTLTYVNYLGEMIFVLILGGETFSLDHVWRKLKPRFASFERYTFPILRVLFGISLIYASIYAKLIHSDLALDTVKAYHLTTYFHFSPMFLVLGAMIVEILIGLFYIIGMDIRFTSLFFLTFLTISLIFFKEAVWPHFVLIGVAIALFMHGYDDFTIEKKVFAFFHNGNEPVL